MATTLTQSQINNAALIYAIGTTEGKLPPNRAVELVSAAYAESGLNPNAVNPKSGAAGLFQLLSQGYRDTASSHGGLYDAAANTRAILPSYTAYWSSHPNAQPGEAGRDVEASGEPASFYSSPIPLIASSSGIYTKAISEAATIQNGQRPILGHSDVQGMGFWGDITKILQSPYTGMGDPLGGAVKVATGVTDAVGGVGSLFDFFKKILQLFADPIRLLEIFGGIALVFVGIRVLAQWVTGTASSNTLAQATVKAIPTPARAASAFRAAA